MNRESLEVAATRRRRRMRRRRDRRAYRVVRLRPVEARVVERMAQPAARRVKAAERRLALVGATKF